MWRPTFAGSPLGVKVHKVADKRTRQHMVFEDTMSAMASRFDTIDQALMRMTESHMGETTTDMERTLLRTPP